MQLAKGRQRDLRCANLESSTIDRVHLPRRQDRHDTRRQLDVHKHARTKGPNNWACIASLIESCKLNDVNPHAWLVDTLAKLVNRWPAARIDELMPWTYPKAAQTAVNV